MSLARRREYLNAMGIDTWIPRSASLATSEPGLMPALVTETETLRPLTITACAPAVAGRIIIGPGTGNTLLLCGSSNEAATALAADIARSLEGEPVWSWPAHDESAPGMPLAQAIEEHLFTRVLIFGRDLVTPAEDSTSRVIGSAHLIWADSIPNLVESAAARRRLWLELSAKLWCAERARKT